MAQGTQFPLLQASKVRLPKCLSAAALLLGLLITANAQTPLPFDAATIKLDQRGPGERGMHGGPGTTSPGRVSWHKAWRIELVAAAYRVDLGNVSGPGWIGGNGGQLYAFEATLPPQTSQHDFELMFQRFLTEQFSLKLHHEPKMFPAYALEEAPGGAKLKATADPDAHNMLQTQFKIGDDGFPVLPPGQKIAIALRGGGYYAKYQNFTMSEFVKHLISWVTPSGEPTHYVSAYLLASPTWPVSSRQNRTHRSLRFRTKIRCL